MRHWVATHRQVAQRIQAAEGVQRITPSKGMPWSFSHSRCYTPCFACLDTLSHSLQCAQASKQAAEAATAAKGSYGNGIGEEWNAWLPVAWAIRELADAMDASGQPAPNAISQRPDGQWVVDAFPLG